MRLHASLCLCLSGRWGTKQFSQILPTPFLFCLICSSLLLFFFVPFPRICTGEFRSLTMGKGLSRPFRGGRQTKPAGTERQIKRRLGEIGGHFRSGVNEAASVSSYPVQATDVAAFSTGFTIIFLFTLGRRQNVPLPFCTSICPRSSSDRVEGLL